ncbi:MAG: hypothetical protein LBR38_00280 [Synergistaceae bacterium]|jgi:hypothetical protein|nr:hypothetical protein [Synergistaceae bacterium]
MEIETKVCTAAPVANGDASASGRRYACLDELFAGYDGGYVCRELDSGPPVGEEVL